MRLAADKARTGMLLYVSKPDARKEGEMDTNGKHQRAASTTDQENRTDDEHILELDK